MEMNESSRWTEEEMETAKKGEWFLAALIRLDVYAGPAACVVGLFSSSYLPFFFLTLSSDHSFPLTSSTP